MHKTGKGINKNRYGISLFLQILGGCNSEEKYGRIECGWPNITKEQCLARDCCFNNNGINTIINCFVNRHLGEFTMRVRCSLTKGLMKFPFTVTNN